MTTSSFSTSRHRRIAVLAGALLLIALLAVLLTLAVRAEVPQSWWPRTGGAFSPSADAHPGSAGQDPCDPIGGPGPKGCERATISVSASVTPGADEAPRHGASAVWRVIAPAAGLLAAFAVWRRRGTAGHGRH